MYFKKIIEEICKEENIKFKAISKDWIFVLEKNGVTNFITGYKFGINNHALGELLDDKYATFELLREQNLPVINHNIVYAPTNNNEYAKGNNSIEYLKDLFTKYNKDIVLKINDGTCGANVVHIKDEKTLESQYEKMSNKFFSMSICPFYNIENEYRAIVLNGNVELLYKKIKPVIIGDGKHSIKELLNEFNSDYFKNKDKPEWNKILKDNEKYEYDWRYNLAKGAKADREIESQLKQKISIMAIEIAKKIGLGFGSIDIIKTSDNELFVMEINSGVMMENFIKQIPEGYSIAKKIYTKVIKSYNWNK
ncbi:MAG: hypothetical protein IJH12_00305 [Clostridia bacterium]|nr:hypothetical protein [Clostridia bacterium]